MYTKDGSYIIRRHQEYDKEHIIFIYTNKFIKSPKPTDFWYVDCLFINEKGVDIPACEITKKSFHIILRSDKSYIGFRKDNIEESVKQPIRYKIDDAPQTTIMSGVIWEPDKVKLLMYQLSNSKKLEYYWTYKEKIRIEQIGLDGLNEALTFARKTLDTNNK